jgi:hypothetical protein
MVTDEELGALIARDVFKYLDIADDRCQRIEGRGGTYPKRETTLGGLCETALAEVVANSLATHRSY